MLPSTSDAMSLSDWERILQSYCAQITLLSEIPVTRVEIAQIGHRLRTLMQRSQVTELQRQFARYRCTWIVYMAAIAARNDDRGYWHSLGESLGIDLTASQCHSLGASFLAAVRELGLHTFEDAGGYTYVTPIRLHGGIPAYSLPDFFEFLVLPVVQDCKYVDMKPDQQIAALLSQSTVALWVDSPVRNYLAYGGEVAELFFCACVNMAQQWQQHSDLPSAAALHLPLYVVTTFRNFMENRLQTTGQKRLRAPRLLLDPFSSVELFRLELPSQPVDADRAAWRYWWKIQPLAAGAAHLAARKDHVRVRRIGYDQTTEPKTAPLALPPGPVRVELWAAAPGDDPVASELLGRWMVNLAPLPDQAPILAFRPPRGLALHSAQSLPADVLWLLYPRTAQLKPDGEGRCCHQFGDLWGDWADWQIEEWDLSKARLLTIETPKSTSLLTIRNEVQEPHFAGGALLAAVDKSDSIPFYVGAPPRLWLPRTPGRALPEELAAWRVAVASRWAAAPNLPEIEPAPLTHWAQYVVESASGIELPLAAILGTQPLGLFTVTVAGPHNLRVQQRLRIWPQLALQDWQPYYLPGSRGAEPIHFSVRVPPEHQVVVQPGVEGVQMAKDPAAGCYAVSVQPDKSDAPLFLEALQPGGETIRVALHLSTPRLRWKLTTDQTVGEWSTAPIRLPLDRLLQARTSYITLELDSDMWPAYMLALSDSGDARNNLQESPWHQPQPRQQRQHIPLGEYSSTLRHLVDCPAFFFTLVVDTYKTAMDLPLLCLYRSLEVTAVVLEWTDEGATDLHWEAAHRLRNRRVRLWSVWQPWTEPYEFCIPDDAAATEVSDEPGSGVLRLPQALPRSWYWVTFRTAPNWEPPNVPARPPADALLSKDVDAEWRLIELEDLAARSAPETAFVIWFERACIFDSQQNLTLRAQEIQRLFKQRRNARPDHLLAFYQWLHGRDASTQRAVRMTMYDPSLLHRVLATPELRPIRPLYLASFTAERIISPESALLILQTEQAPDLVGHALRILVTQGRVEAVEHLLEKAAAGAFSEQDALTFLKLNADFCAETLLSQPRSPVQERLAVALLPLTGSAQLVRQGDWIHTEAGWGRVQKILLDGNERQFFDTRWEKPVLDVLLRPGQNAAHVRVDLANQKIVFAKGCVLYQCSKEGCQGFISPSRDDVTYEHNRAAHGGLSPGFSQLANESWKFRVLPQYKREAPANLYS